MRFSLNKGDNQGRNGEEMKRHSRSTDSWKPGKSLHHGLAAIAVVALSLGWTACSDPETGYDLERAKSTVSHPAHPTLGLSGESFTINGSPTFLLGVSYFDGYNYHLSDLDRLRDDGYNLIRIWLDWRDADFFDADGAWKSGAEARALELVNAASDRGIVVDVTILSAAGAGPDGDYEDLGVAEQVVRNAVRSLRNEPNVFFDSAERTQPPRCEVTFGYDTPRRGSTRRSPRCDHHIFQLPHLGQQLELRDGGQYP